MDHALVVADETIDGEWGYVAMSRGRHTNHLYLADTDRADPRRHAPEPTEDATVGLARRLRISRADTPLADRDVYDPVETAIRWQQLTHELHDARGVDHQRRTLQRQLDELAEQQQPLRVWYARDRTRLEEISSGVSRLTKGARRERDRLTGALQGYVERAQGIDERADGPRRQLAELGERPDIDAWEAEADRLRDVLDAVSADNVRRYEQHPPRWVVDVLGAPPDRPEDRAVWRDFANRVEAFRVRWQIDDAGHALGPPPVAEVQDRDRSDVVAHLREAVRRMGRTESPEHDRGLVRQRSIGHGLGR